MGPEHEHRFAIEPLGDQHHRAALSCGVEVLDSYLYRQAGQDTRKRAALAFVAMADGKTVAGFFTLSQSAIQLDAVPEEIAKKLPKYPMVPTTPVGRIAASTEFRGQRLGELLSMDALHRSVVLSEQAASADVIVDATGSAVLSHS